MCSGLYLRTGALCLGATPTGTWHPRRRMPRQNYAYRSLLARRTSTNHLRSTAWSTLRGSTRCMCRRCLGGRSIYAVVTGVPVAGHFGPLSCRDAWRILKRRPVWKSSTRRRSWAPRFSSATAHPDSRGVLLPKDLTWWRLTPGSFGATSRAACAPASSASKTTAIRDGRVDGRLFSASCWVLLFSLRGVADASSGRPPFLAERCRERHTTDIEQRRDKQSRRPFLPKKKNNSHDLATAIESAAQRVDRFERRLERAARGERRVSRWRLRGPAPMS